MVLVGNRNMETGDRKSETGNWRPETGDWNLERCFICHFYVLFYANIIIMASGRMLFIYLSYFFSFVVGCPFGAIASQGGAVGVN